MRGERGSTLTVMLIAIAAAAVLTGVVGMRLGAERSRVRDDERRLAALWLARTAADSPSARSGSHQVLAGARRLTATLVVERAGPKTTARVSLPDGSTARVTAVRSGSSWSTWDETWTARQQ